MTSNSSRSIELAEIDRVVGDENEISVARRSA
jgi:hypothetical protein